LSSATRCLALGDRSPARASLTGTSEKTGRRTRVATYTVAARLGAGVACRINMRTMLSSYGMAHDATPMNFTDPRTARAGAPPSSLKPALGKSQLRRSMRIVALAALLLVYTEAQATDGGYAELVRQVTPSVVTVLVEEQREGAGQQAVERANAASDYDGMRAIMRRLLSGPGSNPEPGVDHSVLGSGFIIRADGLIVTNRHVIAGARTVKVKLADGRELPAKVVGADPATDIALLRVTAGTLPALQLGSSANIAVGEAVIAIGNPFGLGQSVTAGIVSARGRTLEADPYIDFLQTDAAINSGNSGGPLLSTDGAVIGVTSAIFSPNGGSVGLGFAFPAETVASVIGEIEAHGRVDRGYLGISAQAMTPALARALGVNSDGGALVTALEPRGPAGSILRVGDVLLTIASKPVTFDGLGKITARLRPGTTVEATVQRDGVQLSIPLKIGQLPDPPNSPLMGDRDTWVPNLKMGVANTTKEIRNAIKADDETGGLIVTQLRPAGAGALAGLKIGDLITHAGTKHLMDVADLASVGQPSTKMPLLLRVLRDGTPRFLAVTGSDER
jgi:serine protease Do